MAAIAVGCHASHVDKPSDVRGQNARPQRPDGRWELTEFQHAVIGIRAKDVKAVYFVLDGEFPEPRPAITGPVKSTAEIEKILHAFQHASYAAQLGSYGEGVGIENEEIWIAQRNGTSIVLQLNGYPDRYGFFYGKEVAEIMHRHHGSSSYDQIKAAGADKSVVRPAL